MCSKTRERTQHEKDDAGNRKGKLASQATGGQLKANPPQEPILRGFSHTYKGKSMPASVLIRVGFLCDLCVIFIFAFFAVKGLILLQFGQKALNRKVRKEGPRRAQRLPK
jgi:hypothetical protein